ncbi:reverse transcriptase domain-containing protein [Tanacetum coccineum]
MGKLTSARNDEMGQMEQNGTQLGDQVKLERWQGMVRARAARSDKDGLLGVQGEEVAFFLVPKCTLPIQGMRSIISTVSISPEGFLPSILLLVVIIITVVIVVVTVILVVVVVAIIGVVIVVTIIGVVVVVMIIGVVGVVVVSSIIKLLFVIIGTDIAKISRKRLKPDKHGHGNGRAHKEPGECSARIWLEKEPPRSILTWDDLVSKFINQFFPPSKTTNLRNEITRFQQRFDESFYEAWDRFNDLLRACPHHGFSELHQLDTFYNALNANDQDSLNSAAGGNFLDKMPRECLRIIESKFKVRNSRNKAVVSKVSSISSTPGISPDVAALTTKVSKLKNMMKTRLFLKKLSLPLRLKRLRNLALLVVDLMLANESLMRNLQSQINELRGNFSKEEENLRRNLGNDMRSILGSFFQNKASTLGTLPSNTIPNPKGEMKAITSRSGVAYEEPSIPTNPSPKKVVERETEETTDKEENNFQGSIAHIPPPVNPILIPEPDVLKTLPKQNIPYPSRCNDQKSRDKASNQMEKIFQIFQDLLFNISFANALLLMPRFAPTIKSLLMNKEKLLELAKIPLNENCSAMLLKKLPEKLGDPDKFLIPCDFPGMDVCHALADLGASINLMPLSIWKKLSLPELTPTRMTLELADRSITRPKGVAEDVFVKVGKFHFPTDFVVVDFEADPRVPLILGRSFLRTGRALIDVYGEEITLRVNDEAVTFNLNQTTRYSSTYDDTLINRIDVIDVACEEFSQEFTDLDDDFYDTEGDILYLEQLLNEDPSPTLPQKKNEDLKQKEVTKAKPSIEEPPELELKDLPSHLEYAYLEENDKLPVIIAKSLKDDEKEALLCGWDDVGGHDDGEEMKVCRLLLSAVGGLSGVDEVGFGVDGGCDVGWEMRDGRCWPELWSDSGGIKRRRGQPNGYREEVYVCVSGEYYKN